MIDVAVVAMDGTIGSGTLGCLDVLDIANRIEAARGRAEPRFRAELLSTHGNAVTTSGGIRLEVRGRLTDRNHDVIIVPGTETVSGREMTRIVGADTALRSALRDAHARGAIIAGACTGVWYLAEAGLLDGHAATTSWWLMRAFARRFPQVVIDRERIVRRTGNVYTAGAATAYLNLMLELIGRFAGDTIQRDTAKFLLIDVNRLPQAAFIPLHVANPGKDRLIDAAEQYIQQHLTGTISVDAVAAHCNVTHRTLQRHFQRALGQTPLAYIRNQRLERAKALLETTALPLQDIVSAVGYEDASSFIAMFRRATGTTPATYRRHLVRREPPEPAATA